VALLSPFFRKKYKEIAVFAINVLIIK